MRTTDDVQMTNSPTTSLSPIEEFLGILDLEPLEKNLFRGFSPQVGWSRVYGGLVIAQALVAAMRSVEERRVHSLHAYFLLPGDPSTPIIYDVERIRDGKSFTTRRVVAIQHGAPIFVLSASFHAQEPGLAHQIPMPDVAMPDKVPDDAALRMDFVPRLSPTRQTYWNRKRPIEMRPVDAEAYFNRKPGAPMQDVWMRATGPLPDDPAIHAAILAYASDMTLLDCAMVPHGKSVADPDIMPASLDHALWFHEDFRADDWLLYTQDSPWSGHGRGLGRGLVYTRQGRLVASVMQEGLVRLRRG
jgi:acyl-CoA thioesterase II